MLKVLHITPHMGGGVGNVISGLATTQSNRISHRIVLLEAPENLQYYNSAISHGVEMLICPDVNTLGRSMAESDIVLIHWWHHPKTARLLYDFPKTPVRLVFWTHISNLTTPALDSGLIAEAARVIFTTDASYEAEIYKELSAELLNEKTGVVPGCGGLDGFRETEHKAHRGFNIGYLGLLDFSKLHPDFMSFCSAVEIKDAAFILAGEAPARVILERRAKELGITNPFIYTGYITDIAELLSEFDIFGYPLAPYHTGTTENVVLEAMAAEVPPVLLRQLAEKHIVEDGRTGILVSNPDEYGKAIRYLYQNEDKRRQIGKNARDYVMNKYLKENILDAFCNNCELAMKEDKKIINIKGLMGSTPAQWFLSCLGKDKGIFLKSYRVGADSEAAKIHRGILNCSPLMKRKNKSSILHYEKEFPEDPMLRIWANIVREETIQNE